MKKPPDNKTLFGMYLACIITAILELLSLYGELDILHYIAFLPTLYIFVNILAWMIDKRE